jgi:GST-like protein
MIELFFIGSPNVWKIMICLEEIGYEYQLTPVDLSKGHQFDSSRMGGAITCKLPVILDRSSDAAGNPQPIFESGAILLYLAEKSGLLFLSDAQLRREALQWLFWQVGNLGPVNGQAWHFIAFAKRLAPAFDNSYSFNRYFKMLAGLWDVMERQLGDREFLIGEYSIADIACYPWINYIEPQEGIDAYPNIVRWRECIAARPAVVRAYVRNDETRIQGDLYGKLGFKNKGGSNLDWNGLVKHTIVGG